MKDNQDNLCVLYARVSSRGQREKGLSLAVQEAMLETYAQQQNFVVVKKWIAAESAIKPGRKDFGAMIDFVREEKIPNILCQELDRISRNKGDSAIVDELIESGVIFHLVGDRKIIDQDGENDVFMRDIVSAVSRREVRQTQKRTSRARMKRLESGEYVCLSPVGYLNIPKMKGSKKRYKKVEDIASKVKKVLLRYNTGLYTLSEMLNYAKKIGLNSKQEKEIKVTAMRYLLTNYFYAGMWKFTDIKAGKVLFEGDSKGQWEKIVDKSVIDENIKILECQTSPSKKMIGFDFRFKNLMVCGGCGRTVLGERGGYPMTLKNGKIVSYDVVYYHCHKSPYKDKKTGEKVKCNLPFFPEDLVEQEIIGHLGLLEFDETEWNKIKKELFNFDAKELLNQEQKLLRTEQTRLEKRLDYLLDQKINNEVKEEYFNEKKSEWSQRIFEIRDELENLDLHIDNWNADVGKMIEVVDNLKDFKSKWIKMTPKKGDSKKVLTEKKERQRNMLKLITKRISTFAYTGALTKRSKPPIINKLRSRRLDFEWSPEFEILFENGIIKKSHNGNDVDKFLMPKQQIEKPKVQADNKHYLQFNNFRSINCQMSLISCKHLLLKFLD